MAGVDGFGTQLRRGDGATPTELFTAIAKVTNVGGPGLARETIDVTAHDSPDQWREFVGGLKDGGEVSLDINYNPTDHDTLVDDFEDDAPRNYELAFPTTPETVWGLSLILTGFEPTGPVDDKLSATVTFKVTGKPTLDQS